MKIFYCGMEVRVPQFCGRGNEEKGILLLEG